MKRYQNKRVMKAWTKVQVNDFTFSFYISLQQYESKYRFYFHLLNEATYACEVYFESPADATMFMLKWWS